jgi:ribosome-binding factor A
MRRRQVRVSELLREEVSEILQKMKDPRVGFASVTRVEVSPDLRHARVMVSVLGDAEARERTLQAMESARGYIRGVLAERLHLRFVPEIVFSLDRSIEHGARIQELLREIREGGKGIGSH